MSSSTDEPAAPVWAIVVAGGSGRRFGSPKQWQRLQGRSLAAISVDTARSACDGVVLVVPEHEGSDSSTATSADSVVSGGDTRAESVRRGLSAVPAEAGIIVVHDAVRPKASVELFHAVIAEVRSGADGAIPAIPVVDTLKSVRPDGSVERTVDRDSLMAVQTPQAFSAVRLREAHASDPDATDDAGLVEDAGGRVVVVAGEVDNMKVTTQADLHSLRSQSSLNTPTLRVGHGFDVHRWSDERRPLVLGGVTVDTERGLAGHSDADVVCHAVCDALLGAAGLGDIGRHFPDDDQQWAGAHSTDLLDEVVRLVKEAGWTPISTDVTVMAEAPHLAAHIAEMQSNLGRMLGISASVKATRAEGLGALGRGEGIAAWAVALLSGA